MYIFSNAAKQSDYESKIALIFPEVITHIAKLYLFPNNINKNHWQREIYAFISQVPKLKHSKKFPTAKWIVDKTIGEYTDRLDVFEANLLFLKNSGIPNMRENATALELYEICQSYMNWLAEKLSTRGLVFEDEVKTQLTKLIDSNPTQPTEPTEPTESTE